MDYATECEAGRAKAADAIADCAATGATPKFVNEIRAAAADQTGFGVGFLYALAAATTARGKR